MKRAIILIIGWLAAVGALLYALLRLDLHWNFFDWSPRWDLEAVAELLGVLVAVGAIWFLGKASRDKASRFVSVLVCVLVAALAFVWYPAEAKSGGFLGRTQPSPFWFRGGRALLLCVPAVIWFWWRRRHLAQQCGPANGSQPFRSE